MENFILIFQHNESLTLNLTFLYVKLYSKKISSYRHNWRAYTACHTDIIHWYVCKMFVSHTKSERKRRRRNKNTQHTTATNEWVRLMLLRTFHAVHSLPTTFEPSGQKRLLAYSLLFLPILSFVVFPIASYRVNENRATFDGNEKIKNTGSKFGCKKT